MKFKIKKKDTVIVISGKDKGKTGEVLEIIAGDAFKPRACWSPRSTS